MKRHIARAVTLLAALSMSLGSSASAEAQSLPCGLASPAFCDTFDQPFNGSGRTGQLDPARWTVARNGSANPSQGLVNLFVGSNAMHCQTPVTGVMPDADYFVCGTEFGESNHFMEAFDDQGGYLYNDARIRQPFDFAGRTGKITFDVDAKTFGSHSWWPEVWITDEPVPSPHLNVIESPPRNGIGLEFSGGCANSSTGDPIPNAIGTGTGNLGLVDISRNYHVEPMINFWQAGPNGEHFTIPWGSNGYVCYRTMPDMKNHFELRVSQNRIEVWATDHDTNVLRMTASIDNLNLPFTRGFVHLQHAAYNAEKGGGTHAQTYHWDNVGFDGPVLPVPALYSVPDALQFGGGGVNLGYIAGANGLQAGARTLQNVSLAGANSASMTFQPWIFNGFSLNYRFNGGPWHVYTDPEQNVGGWLSPFKSAIVPVPLSELHEGANTVDFASMPGDSGPAPFVSSIDLIMEGSGQASLPAPTATVTSTPVATTTPTATSTPVPSATATVVVPTVTSTALPTKRHGKPTPRPTSAP
jgi:hypothetical protein